MSRESAASLEVAAISIPQRPEPPNDFTPELADIWRRITATKPPDWFEFDTQQLLEAYCKTIDFDRRLTREMIHAIEQSASLIETEKLYKLTEKNAKLMAHLATKMRLTPQSRYTPKASATANKKSGGSARPWQT